MHQWCMDVVGWLSAFCSSPASQQDIPMSGNVHLIHRERMHSDAHLPVPGIGVAEALEVLRALCRIPGEVARLVWGWRIVDASAL